MYSPIDEFRAWIAPMLIPLPDLPEGLRYNDESLKPETECHGCGCMFIWPVDVSEFDDNDPCSHLCGGSPWCCP